MYPREWCISRGVLCQAEARGLSRTLLTEIQFNNGWVSVINSHKAEREISFYTDLWLYFPQPNPRDTSVCLTQRKEGWSQMEGTWSQSRAEEGSRRRWCCCRGAARSSLDAPKWQSSYSSVLPEGNFSLRETSWTMKPKSLIFWHIRGHWAKTSCKFQNSKRSC